MTKASTSVALGQEVVYREDRNQRSGSRMILNREQSQCWLGRSMSSTRTQWTARERSRRPLLSNAKDQSLHVNKYKNRVCAERWWSVNTPKEGDQLMPLMKQIIQHNYRMNDKTRSVCVSHSVCVSKAGGERPIHLMMPPSCSMLYICPKPQL